VAIRFKIYGPDLLMKIPLRRFNLGHRLSGGRPPFNE
jgi:hypothetical protein